MKRLIRSRIVRVACPVVTPPAQAPACTERSEHVPPALSANEGSRAEGSGAKELALSQVERARPLHTGRHARLCAICCHPDRDAIEEDFIHWHSPSDVVFDYHLPDRSSVYRHAHATGLFARRSRNLRFVLERLLERVDKVKVTAHAVVRAVRAYTRINDRGEWVEPPTRIIVSAAPPPLPPSPALPAPSGPEESQREGSKARCLRSGRICGAQPKPRSNRNRRPQSR